MPRWISSTDEVMYSAWPALPSGFTLGCRYSDSTRHWCQNQHGFLTVEGAMLFGPARDPGVARPVVAVMRPVPGVDADRLDVEIVGSFWRSNPPGSVGFGQRRYGDRDERECGFTAIGDDDRATLLATRFDADVVHELAGGDGCIGCAMVLPSMKCAASPTAAPWLLFSRRWRAFWPAPWTKMGSACRTRPRPVPCGRCCIRRPAKSAAPDPAARACGPRPVLRTAIRDSGWRTRLRWSH